jgi:beta-galactosidase
MRRKKLSRRRFIETGSASLIGLASLSKLSSLTLAQSAPGSSRRIYPLNHNWLFSEKNLPNATQPRFNDVAFKRVTIPHTNKMLPWHGFDDKEYEFVSVYRRHFRPPLELQGRRVFIDFGGAMTAATVWINGQRLGEYRGGYTPFSFELTSHLNWKGDNVIAVEVDSTERKDIPPFGHLVDYLTFGGIYRDVQIRFVDQTFIENVFAKPIDVLSQDRKIEVRCYLEESKSNRAPLMLTASLFDGNRVIAAQTHEITPNGQGHYDVTLTNIQEIELWNIDRPKLYQVLVGVAERERVIDQFGTWIGFREAMFAPEGFRLNGKHLKLRGLNRHQTFPYVGQAMPARVQKRDAWILRKELKCNIVRTSHYPQSPHFLDGCDEYGLLVFEEIPGWQHIGNDDWQNLALQNVDKMIRRDWNHPSIILWGVRINESGDNHDLYAKTNALAHSLDDSRPTGGVRNRYGSELLEDVFTMNDFGFPLRPPNHPLYLNTEFNGHMYPTKRNDNVERLREHTHRHARVHNQLASDDTYAGGLGWCAFDYNTHDYFGSGDRICYHGVSDIFRIPKPAAGFYKSQCDPSDEIVLEPAFDWARGDENQTFTDALVCSNCEKLKFYIGDRFIVEVEPDRKTYDHLKYAPFVANLRAGIGGGWDDLRIEGYIAGKKVIERKMSAKGVDRQFVIEPDDRELTGDGIDMTRVILKVVDEFGNVRPFSNAAITLSLQGPGEIIGDNPFALFGGVGAVWLKTKPAAGQIRLKATHETLGSKTVSINVKAFHAANII